jgi:hypothetical protein
MNMASVSQPADWLNDLNEDELRALTDDETLKTAKLGLGMIKAKRGAKPSPFDVFWNEIYLLVCTEDPKYKPLRETLSNKTTKTSAAVTVGAIASEISRYCGTQAAIPVVASLILATLGVSKNAVCVLLARRYND